MCLFTRIRVSTFAGHSHQTLAKPPVQQHLAIEMGGLAWRCKICRRDAGTHAKRLWNGRWCPSLALATSCYISPQSLPSLCHAKPARGRCSTYAPMCCAYVLQYPPTKGKRRGINTMNSNNKYINNNNKYTTAPQANHKQAQNVGQQKQLATSHNHINFRRNLDIGF